MQVNPLEKLRGLGRTNKEPMEPNMTNIVAHNGLFHADDVFAVAVLTALFPEANVVRTRDAQLTTAAPNRIVVDVGGVYDAKAHCFDHHQRDGRRPPRPNGIPYSSFGLIWQEYGCHYIAEMCWTEIDQDTVEVWEVVDRTLVSSIDAADCGFPLTDLRPGFEGCGFGLSRAISLINPPYGGTPADADCAFSTAVSVAGNILRATVSSTYAAAKEAAFVKDCLAERVDPRVLVLPRGATWAGHVEETDVLFVIFPAVTNDTWMVQCVPPIKGSFDKKKPLPEA